jgi:hypothetical protein
VRGLVNLYALRSLDLSKIRGVCVYYPPITHNLAKHQNERGGEIETPHTLPEK